MTDADGSKDVPESDFRPVAPAKPQHSQGLLLGAVVAVAVALGAVLVAFSVGRSNSVAQTAPPAAETSVSNTSTTVAEPSATEALSMSTVATESGPTQPDAETALKDLGAQLGTRSIAGPVMDDCDNEYGMLEVNGSVRFYWWDGGEWIDQSDLLDIDDLETIASQVRRMDYTMGGTYEFLVQFDYDGGSFGGVFGSTGCTWGWLPIRDFGESAPFIDGLNMTDEGVLIASGYGNSAGQKTVYLEFDAVAGEFTTWSPDEPAYEEPVQQAPQRPTVVSTYCEVQATGLSSDMQGTLWTITLWNQWSDGRRTIARSSGMWSWGQPTC